MRGCVVRVAGVWVRGEYSEYGWADCLREGHADEPEQVWLEQFRDYFDAWGVPADAVLGTAVYCADLRRNCCPRRLQILEALPAAPAPSAESWAKQHGFTDSQVAVIGEYVFTQDGVVTVGDLCDIEAEIFDAMLDDMQLSETEQTRFRSLVAAEFPGVSEAPASDATAGSSSDEGSGTNGVAAEPEPVAADGSSDDYVAAIDDGKPASALSDEAHS